MGIRGGRDTRRPRAWESIIGDKPPALAIVDWMMPRLDGIELCRRIRATSLRSPVYVILLTARTSRQDLVAGLEAGADDYLTKPFERDELRARIHVGQRTLDLMANIKQLSGLLPICSHCKRIRSDTDYWEQVESYISDHTDARFSHGICPPVWRRPWRKSIRPRSRRWRTARETHAEPLGARSALTAADND